MLAIPMDVLSDLQKPKVRRSSLSRLMRAVLDADRHIERGDPKAALAAVNNLDTWLAREVQSLARLAEAYLQLEDELPGFAFHKAVALAQFCMAPTVSSQSFWDLRIEVPFPGATWDKEKLESVARRAWAWLEEMSQKK